MGNMRLGIIGTSRKANEKRVPLHPEHLSRLPKALRRQLFFETGYGERFGVSDTEISWLAGGLASRDELLETTDLVILAKPVLADLEQMRVGGALTANMATNGRR